MHKECALGVKNVKRDEGVSQRLVCVSTDCNLWKGTQETNEIGRLEEGVLGGLMGLKENFH